MSLQGIFPKESKWKLILNCKYFEKTCWYFGSFKTVWCWSVRHCFLWMGRRLQMKLVAKSGLYRLMFLYEPFYYSLGDIRICATCLSHVWHTRQRFTFKLIGILTLYIGEAVILYIAHSTENLCRPGRLESFRSSYTWINRFFIRKGRTLWWFRENLEWRYIVFESVVSAFASRN